MKYVETFICVLLMCKCSPLIAALANCDPTKYHRVVQCMDDGTSFVGTMPGQGAFGNRI